MTARHYPISQLFDSSGDPLSGGTIQGYEAGTTTPKLLYLSRDDCNQTINGSLSLTLPADGSTFLWFDDATKTKLVIKDSGGSIIPHGTKDYLSGEFDLTSSSLTLGGVLNLSQGANIASAATTNIGAATGNYVVVTGTTTITALGTAQAGAERLVQFDNTLTLTYNATSLILPGSANITTAAGDVAHFLSLGSGNWNAVRYYRRNGYPIVAHNDFVYMSTKGADIASTSVMDLSASTGDYVNVTGTTPIDNLGIMTPGTRRLLRFSTAVILAHHAGAFILPTGSNITTANGDTAEFLSIGSGIWLCLGYNRIDGSYVGMQKSADIASATTTDLSTATGFFVDVTGTTTITGLGTVPSGRMITVRFTGALTLTHNGTSLILPGAANIVTVAGDTAQFASLGSGNWVCVRYMRSALAPPLLVPASILLQRVSTVTGASATGTTVIPFDDTIPQNTEGDQYMTLAITPKSSTSILKISAQAVSSNGTAARNQAIALFQDSTASALAVANIFENVGTAMNTTSLLYTMTSGTTSSTTFKIRIGANNTGTTTFNGASGGRLFGGVSNSSITIEEYSA